MPILTVVSDTSLRSEDADDGFEGSEGLDGFEDDPPREVDPCPVAVSAEDVARWFG